MIERGGGSERERERERERKETAPFGSMVLSPVARPDVEHPL